MKKTLLLVLSLILLTAALVSCGSSNENPAETKDPLANVVRTEGPKVETTAPATSAGTKEPPKAEDYDYFFKFDAPKGNPRDIVYNYMYAMSQVKWVAAETWTTTWKGTADFKVNLTYTKGKTYYGVPYSRTNGTLDEFQQFIAADGTFTPNSPYYEEIVGNHCSSSMVMAFQQILNFTYSGSLKPTTSREGLLKYPDGIEKPPSRSATNPDDYITANVFSHNGQDKIYEAFTTLDKGDILYKNIDGSGHTRMVSKVEVSRSAAGKILPSRSYVYCLEQTNAWADSKQESTWFIDRKYSFSTLWETFFMPVTLCIYHEENPVIEDAYVMMKGKNTEESLQKMFAGTVESTFPLTYVLIQIKDKDGKVVGQDLLYYYTKEYKANLRNSTYKVGLDKLPAGEYNYTLRVGIARGSVEIENINFTKK